VKPGRKQWRGMLVLFHRTLTQQDSAAQHDTRCTHCAKLHVLHVFLGFPFVVIFSLPLARFLSQSLSFFNTTQFLPWDTSFASLQSLVSDSVPEPCNESARKRWSASVHIATLEQRPNQVIFSVLGLLLTTPSAPVSQQLPTNQEDGIERHHSHNLPSIPTPSHGSSAGNPLVSQFPSLAHFLTM